MAVKLFCNTDDDGRIIESIIGGVALKEYQYEFKIEGKDINAVALEVPTYQIVNGQITIS